MPLFEVTHADGSVEEIEADESALPEMILAGVSGAQLRIQD